MGCACAGNAGNVSPPPWVSDPDMHHGTCVTHVPWCIPGSLTSGFLWSRWREKRSRHSRCMRNPQFYVLAHRDVVTKIKIQDYCNDPWPNFRYPVSINVVSGAYNGWMCSEWCMLCLHRWRISPLFLSYPIWWCLAATKNDCLRIKTYMRGEVWARIFHFA